MKDEPLFCERVGGIDIGKAVVMVTIRVPSETRKGGRQQETREFGTSRRQLLAAADWLRSWHVEKVGMETGNVMITGHRADDPQPLVEVQSPGAACRATSSAGPPRPSSPRPP